VLALCWHCVGTVLALSIGLKNHKVYRCTHHINSSEPATNRGAGNLDSKPMDADALDRMGGAL
jgi:hypothetical protein